MFAHLSENALQLHGKKNSLLPQCGSKQPYLRFQLIVEGHCDERGTREYNLALGERRANAVKEFLVSLGVESGRITTISYGKERPAAEGSTSESWSENRRSVTVISGN